MSPLCYRYIQDGSQTLERAELDAASNATVKTWFDCLDRGGAVDKRGRKVKNLKKQLDIALAEQKGDTVVLHKKISMRSFAVKRVDDGPGGAAQGDGRDRRARPQRVQHPLQAGPAGQRGEHARGQVQGPRQHAAAGPLAGEHDRAPAAHASGFSYMR